MVNITSASLNLIRYTTGNQFNSSGLDARDRSGTSQGRDVQLRSAPAEEVQWWPAADNSESIAVV